MAELLCPIRSFSEKFPNHIAIFEKDRFWTYEQLDKHIDRIYTALLQKGVQKHSKVVFIAKKEINSIGFFFALFRLGAVACPLSIYLSSKELTHFLRFLDPCVFLEPQDFSGPALFSFSGILDENQEATYLFTSGSSGYPKCVCHTLSNHYYSALGSRLALQLSPEDKWLVSLPLYHIAGIAVLFRCFFSGASLVISEQNSSFPETIDFMSLVPTQLYRLLKEDNPPPAKKGILLGGAPIPSDLYGKALERGWKIFPTYGMTEMSSQITMDTSLLAQEEFSLGKPLAYRELAVAEDGEILVRGKTLFKGYRQSKQELRLPLNTNGWFTTGDVGNWDVQKGLTVIGRKDNLFISGGENIYPEEIEKALLSLPGIIQAAVVPVDDHEWGQRPLAFIFCEEGTHYSLERIQDLLRDKISAFKLPSYIDSMTLKEPFKHNRKHLKELALLKYSSALRE